MDRMDVDISLPSALPLDWALPLADFDGRALNAALQREYKDGQEIYPPRHLLYEAFRLTPFDSVRAVWLGQDPYHEPGQAMGVAFAVPNGVTPPPSLRNIFKEYESDLGRHAPLSTDLLSWAKNGVLLLNTALTVRAHSAGSHRKLGWDPFIRAVIKALSRRPTVTAFILLGNDAQKYEDAIEGKQVIFKAPHPSPLSAHRGFFGCHLFTEVNRQLQAAGANPINWTAP